jgi:hypothetical protein
MNTQNLPRTATPRTRKAIAVLHFTVRIVIAGQVIVRRIDATSRATALLQLRCLKKHAAFALLEEH